MDRDRRVPTCPALGALTALALVVDTALRVARPSLVPASDRLAATGASRGQPRE